MWVAATVTLRTIERATMVRVKAGNVGSVGITRKQVMKSGADYNMLNRYSSHMSMVNAHCTPNILTEGQC